MILVKKIVMSISLLYMLSPEILILAVHCTEDFPYL